MKKTAAAIIIFLLALMPLSAGPFINITGVDADSDFPGVKLTVSVISPDHKGIPGIDEENILVFEDGYRVDYKVREASSPADYLHVVIAVDSSKSINGMFLEKIKSEAGNFINASAATDRIAVIRFNDTVRLLNNFTSNRLELQSSIKSVDRHGKFTRLFDGIYDSIELLDKVKGGRKGVIVFTDGKDEGSSLTPDDIIKFSHDTGIPVYFISNNSKTSMHLGRIAKLTGGKYFCVNQKDVACTYNDVISRIKSVYEIRYQSMLKRDNSSHNLEVRLRYGDLKDRDTMEFTVERNIFKFDFPDGFYVIASAFVIASILVLLVLAVHFFRKSRPQKKKGNNEYNPVYSGYSSQVKAEDLVREESYVDEAPAEIPDVLYSQVWLHQKDGREAGKKIPVIKNEITLGTSEENSVIVEDRFASGRHARIRRMQGGYYIFDLISDTGTYLNSKKILRPRLLHDWDEIRMGNTSFIFRGIR
ncbi:MAG TPA: VWA domain-containing protein [Spirochaetota bacterium]|nr:VWA domain-containing protein [Spirochaetota bacterium]